MIYENDALIQGTIVHKYVNDKVTILTLSTGRNAAGIVNYPKIVFFNDSNLGADKFEVYDRVTVRGNVQSSFRRNDERPHVTQSIYGEEIHETPRVMESFGIKEGNYEAPKNQIRLAGEVLSVDEPAKNVVRLLVRTIKNGRTSNVQMFDFTSRAEKLMEEIKTGDNVCVIANVQTSKKEKEGNPVYYENVVVQQIEKVEA